MHQTWHKKSYGPTCWCNCIRVQPHCFLLGSFFFSPSLVGLVCCVLEEFNHLTTSLPCCHLKRPIKVQNLKPCWNPKAFFAFFFALTCERIFIRLHGIESRCYRTQKYTVCRHIPASFSLEVLQAWAVKGLIVILLSSHVYISIYIDITCGTWHDCMAQGKMWQTPTVSLWWCRQKSRK